MTKAARLNASLIGLCRRISVRPMAAPASRAATSSSGVAKNSPATRATSLSEKDCALLRKCTYTRQDSVTQKAAISAGSGMRTGPPGARPARPGPPGAGPARAGPAGPGPPGAGPCASGPTGAGPARPGPPGTRPCGTRPAGPGPPGARPAGAVEGATHPGDVVQ